MAEGGGDVTVSDEDAMGKFFEEVHDEEWDGVGELGSDCGEREARRLPVLGIWSPVFGERGDFDEER